MGTQELGGRNCMAMRDSKSDETGKNREKWFCNSAQCGSHFGMGTEGCKPEVKCV